MLKNKEKLRKEIYKILTELFNNNIQLREEDENEALTDNEDVNENENNIIDESDIPHAPTKYYFNEP